MSTSDTPIADNIHRPPPGMHHEDFQGAQQLHPPYTSADVWRNIGGNMSVDRDPAALTPHAEILASLRHEVYAARESLRIGMQRPEGPDWPVIAGELTGALENIGYYAAWLDTPKANG
jgi:hypothetical protein